MESCFRCERDENEVRLLDAIYENDMVKICEKCSITESIPVIRKPTTSQLKESERSYGVYQRLKRMSRGKEEKKAETVLDQIRRLEENPNLEKPMRGEPFNLVENFHWQIARARRNKGLSQKQLGWALAESETVVKMIEKAELPDDAEKLIRKLEQFFQIELREKTEAEKEEERRKKAEKESFKIPRSEPVEFEEPVSSIVEEQERGGVEVLSEETINYELGEKELELEKLEEERPARILKFKPELMDNVTISELQEMKAERDKENRLVAIEQERKEALQAQALVQELRNKEKRKQEVLERVGQEMIEIATGKLKTPEQRKEDRKREMEKVPTIDELMQRKRERSMVGGEIELAEGEKLDEDE